MDFSLSWEQARPEAKDTAAPPSSQELPLFALRSEVKNRALCSYGTSSSNSFTMALTDDEIKHVL